MEVDEIKRLLRKALAIQHKECNRLALSEEPDDREAYGRADGKARAFLAVLDAYDDMPKLLICEATGGS